MNALLPKETEEAELQVLEELWFHPFGFPSRLKIDALGADMSQRFLDIMDYYKIKLVLIPKEAHFKLGTVERLHAMRRLQLLKMKKEMPNVDLHQAIRTACTQRNRLCSIYGSSPTELVFGKAPNAFAGLIDESHDLRPELPQAAQDLAVLRTLAAKTFHEANNDALLRRSLLARPRSEHEPLQLGSWAYYWRQGDSKLESSRWRGPSFIFMVEPKPMSNSEKFRPQVYWLAHGASLVRVAPEHIRPELPRERLARLENMPDTAQSKPVQDQIKSSSLYVPFAVQFDFWICLLSNLPLLEVPLLRMQRVRVHPSSRPRIILQPMPRHRKTLQPMSDKMHQLHWQVLLRRV